jgi:hypothetical protein
MSEPVRLVERFLFALDEFYETSAFKDNHFINIVVHFHHTAKQDCYSHGNIDEIIVINAAGC